MKRTIRRLAGVAIAVGLAIAAGFVWLSLPFQGFQGETFVRFERGAGTPAMAAALEKAGVIRSRYQFWLARAVQPDARLQAGEYRFSGPSSALTVFRRIARGDIFFFEIHIPEGSNIFDIARIVESAGAMAAEDFLRAASDAAPIRDIDPQARTLEGYLFPSTYRISHSTTAEELCRTMTAQFRRQWKKLAPEASEPHSAVTLASMVEKETGTREERPLVASVFTNRLNIGMKLDCDPTTIYAALLEKRYHGVIHQSDLSSHNSYNTYQNPGLPPGPIANPGADAIAAALHPAETNYLYFVAKPGGGGHQFSATLDQHDQAVRAYRKTTERARPARTPRAAKRSK